MVTISTVTNGIERPSIVSCEKIKIDGKVVWEKKYTFNDLTVGQKFRFGAECTTVCMKSEFVGTKDRYYVVLDKHKNIGLIHPCMGNPVVEVIDDVTT